MNNVGRMTLGQNMKRLRLEKDMSQQAICDVVGIKRSTYSNYENDIRVPKTKYIERIAQVLDVPMERFYEGISMDMLYREYRVFDECKDKTFKDKLTMFGSELGLVGMLKMDFTEEESESILAYIKHYLEMMMNIKNQSDII